MKHYSVMATEIFIHELHSENGWRLGDPMNYEVNNCAWKSLVKVFLPGDRSRINDLIVQPYYVSGDRGKMIRDSQSLNIALQTHIGQQYNMIFKEII